MQKCFMSFRGGESILILTHVSSLGWSFVRIQLACAQLSLLILPIESEFQDAVCAFACGGVCTGWVSGISHWEVLRLLVCLLKIRSGMLKRCPPNAAAQRDVSLVAHCMTFLHGLLRAIACDQPGHLTALTPNCRRLARWPGGWSQRGPGWTSPPCRPKSRLGRSNEPQVKW